MLGSMPQVRIMIPPKGMVQLWAWIQNSDDRTWWACIGWTAPHDDQLVLCTAYVAPTTYASATTPTTATYPASTKPAHPRPGRRRPHSSATTAGPAHTTATAKSTAATSNHPFRPRGGSGSRGNGMNYVVGWPPDQDSTGAPPVMLGLPLPCDGAQLSARARRPSWPEASTESACLPQSGLTYVRLLQVSDLRVTVAVARVLREFLADPADSRYGYDLMRATSFPSGKLYPILARLVRAGWLVREQEVCTPVQEGRPARFYYRLTPDGVAAARQELALLSSQITGSASRFGYLRPEGGLA